MEEDNRVYFARRAAEEQARAEECTDAHAAEAHRKLQRAYAERASVGNRHPEREIVG
jgi:hypothetical protein